MLRARNRWYYGPASGCDQHMLGAEAPLAHRHRMLVDQDRASVDDRRTGRRQRIAIDAVQALNLVILVGNEPGPVKTAGPDAPAKAWGLFKCRPVLGCVDQQLLRDTADVDA